MLGTMFFRIQIASRRKSDGISPIATGSVFYFLVPVASGGRWGRPAHLHFCSQADFEVSSRLCICMAKIYCP